MKDFIAKYQYHLLFLAIFIIYFFNMFLDVMEVDAAQYASISREMSESKSYLQIFHRGNDYLDKPPLLFWLSSLSISLLGLSNLAFKLPSVLMAMLGIFSTYKFTRLWYDKDRALAASLILASTQAMFQMTNDIRTDTLLTSLFIFSVWQLSAYLKEGKWHALILGSIGVGAAMLAKGPIGLVAPAVALFFDIVAKRHWSDLFKPQWLLLVLIVAAILLPFSYGLYTQFDLHPEKFVYNLQGPSGLRFFYWTQSFGRITGEIYWDNGAPFYYFLTTMPWDLQPWILLFIPALIYKIRQLIRQKFHANRDQEFISTFGFILVFLMLSSSNYKLPHYVFVLFPFAAIITSDFLFSLKEKGIQKLSRWYFGYMQLFVVMVVLAMIFVFPPVNVIIPVICAFLLILSWIAFYRIKEGLRRLIIPTILITIFFQVFMTFEFYPGLLKYQSSSVIGKVIEKENKAPDMVYYRHFLGHGLDFYGNRIIPHAPLDEIDNFKTGAWIITNEKGWDEIKGQSDNYEILMEVDQYNVAAISMNFLNIKTRPSVLKKSYVLEKLR